VAAPAAVAVLMTIAPALLISWPWIEKPATDDDAHHNLPRRPRDVPVRTAIGATGIAST
jgi:ubiquinol-cytochrome c reductase cytochrome b subunit